MKIGTDENNIVEKMALVFSPKIFLAIRKKVKIIIGEINNEKYLTRIWAVIPEMSINKELRI